MVILPGHIVHKFLNASPPSAKSVVIQLIVKSSVCSNGKADTPVRIIEAEI